MVGKQTKGGGGKYNLTYEDLNYLAVSLAFQHESIIGWSQPELTLEVTSQDELFIIIIIVIIIIII